MPIIIDGIEYLPRADVPPITDDAIAVVLVDLVNIHRASHHTDKRKGWAWNALNVLSPEIAELANRNPDAALARINPD